MSNAPQAIRDALFCLGFSGGEWLRSRQPTLNALAVNSTTGGWKDHRTGESGNWHALCQKLGIESDFSSSFRAYDQEVYQEYQEAQAKKKIQRAKTLWARAVPAVPQKQETQEEKKKWEDYREAIFDYLSMRGLEPSVFLPLIRLKMLEPSGMDQEMQGKGADFCFLIPMFELGERQIKENICGVQRTYLQFSQDKYQRTQKVGRAMIGKKGVTLLSPSENMQPVLLPEPKPVLGVGEGFETVGSWVSVLRRTGLVCWDWSGLKTLSEKITPSDKTPVLAFLADADASQTGQRESSAAVRRIIVKGGHAVYLLPPDSISPDEKGNRDWNDLLVQNPDRFAAEIVTSWYLSQENLEKVPVYNDEQIIKKEYMQDAVEPQEIAESIDRALAYHVAEKAVIEYLEKYRQYLADLVAYKNTTAEDRKNNGIKKPKLPPLLINITTGVGKSHMIREILHNSKIQKEFGDLAFLVLTRTHDLANEYADAGAAQYFGRSKPFCDPKDTKKGYTEQDIKDNNFASSTCFKYPVIELVAQNNHVPALTACRNCEHGRKFMIENYHEASQPYQDARAWFDENGFSDQKIEELASCMWLSHQAHISRQKIVVAPNASFSDSLSTWKGAPSGEDEQRLVIVDEIPDLTRSIEATSADLGIHARNIVNILAKEDLDKELKSDFLKAKEFIAEIAKFLAESVGQEKEKMYSLPSDLIQKACDLKVNWLPGATARWEKAEIRYGHEAFIPLRMTRALLQSAATKTAKVADGKLHIFEITSLGEAFIKGKPMILLDATPSLAVQRIIEKNGGQIVKAIAKQHVKIVHFNQYLHGRTYKNKQHKEDELTNLMIRRQEMQAETGAMPNVLTYMPLCELSGAADSPDWGYFGRDDIGQDNWKGENLLIYGGPIFSPVTQAIAYNSELMLMRLAKIEGLTDWDDEVERGVEVTVGSKIDVSKAPLPKNLNLREWVLQDYGRRIAQAVGRVRGVWAQDCPLHVWIYGGLTLAGLAAHGLEVAEFRQEKKINMNDQSHKDAKKKVQAAIASLQSADKDESYRQVQKELERMGLPGVRYSVWQQVASEVQTVYDLDTSSHEVVDALLSSLRTIEIAAQVGETDVSDAAKSIFEHPLTPQITRAAAQLVLESSPDAARWRDRRQP